MENIDADCKEKIVRVIRQMLTGKKNLILGCQELSGLTTSFDTLEYESLITFHVVREEADLLSINADNIDTKSEEIKRLLSIYEPCIKEDCKMIYRAFMSEALETKFKLVEEARNIIAGKDVFAGCQKICGLVNILEELLPGECDSMLMSFVGVDSELDLAILDPYLRSRYDPKTLAENDIRVEQYRKDITPVVLEDCREIIRRYD